MRPERLADWIVGVVILFVAAAGCGDPPANSRADATAPSFDAKAPSVSVSVASHR
jgi:hypothetical protein